MPPADAETSSAPTSASLIQATAPPPSKPSSASAAPSKPAPPPPPNPALRILGLSKLPRLRLPSRNWLIFLSVTGSITSAILYDRHHKKRNIKRWCEAVRHLSSEPLPTKSLPRTVKVYLCASPGDGIGVARDHFVQYVKPVLVAAALEWEVVEGREEGALARKVVEDVRKRRRDLGEKKREEVRPSQIPTVESFRRDQGVGDFIGGGEMVIGRNTWKEYVRGQHAGWLGPLEDSPVENHPLTAETSSEDPAPSTTDAEVPIPPAPLYPEGLYEEASLTPYALQTLGPVLPIPYPHILGFLNTPFRIYRFLNRRHLADDIGQRVASLCLTEPALVPPVQDEVRNSELVKNSLIAEEPDWPKRHRNPPVEESGEVPLDRIWARPVAVDSRIAGKLRFYDIGIGTSQSGLSYD